jgi:hypothetical protein
VFAVWYADAPDTVDDQVHTAEMQLCPFDTPPGTYELTGTVEYGSSWDYDYRDPSAPGSLQGEVHTTFTVSTMASSVQLNAIGSASYPGQIDVSGRITATSTTLGIVGVPLAEASIQQFVSGGWSHAGSVFTDALGNFRARGYDVATGAPIRVVFEGTSKVAGSNSASVPAPMPAPAPAPPALAPAPAPPRAPAPAQPAAAPTPTVKVKAVGGASKLRVDVNPNKGAGHWRFQVQKQRPDGTWQPLKSYKTLGSKETRTVNLKKGAYRVIVLPKYRYGVGESRRVSLKR